MREQTMTQLFKKLFPGETVTIEARRPQGKIAIVNKVEIPHRAGFTVVRRDILQAALKAKTDEAA